MADEDHALHGNGAVPQRLEREQRVVDGAERRSCAEHKRNLPAGEDIGEEHRVGQRHQKPARPLDHQRSIRLRRQQQRGVDRYILEAGR